jgi:hypothetical protein
VVSTSDEELAPERYKVQFTATEEYARLVEEAKALLAHAAPRASIEEVHLRAMRALVTALKKMKYGAAALGARNPHQRGEATNHPRRR